MNRRDRARAFTLIELLVSLAIIFVLITMALYVLGPARRSAGRAEALNALRQMLAAHEAYTQNHKDRFMPGFIDPADFGPSGKFANLVMRGPDGAPLSAQDKASYVWRLAPYLDNAWKTFMVDYDSTSFHSRLDGEYSEGIYSAAFGAQAPPYGIATRPAFGINAMFVGGDSYHGGLGASAPWNTSSPRAATRPSQVKSPPKLIVFGATSRYPLASGVEPVQLGYCELRPPYAGYNPTTGATSEPQWTYVNNQAVPVAGAAPCGVPFDRRSPDKGEHVPLGFQDGSVGTEHIFRLSSDMSRWSPFAVSTR